MPCREIIVPLFTKGQKSKSDYESEVTVYECEDYTGCPCKEKCTKAKGNKRLYISKSFQDKRQESYENILNETGTTPSFICAKRKNSSDEAHIFLKIAAWLRHIP